MDDVYALKRQGRTRTLYGVGRGCFLSLTLLLASVKEKIIVYSSAKAFKGSKKDRSIAE
ncbi:unnamed protein product [Brassica rapa]|uniref:Uncharacterized protein n=1 Tax=Brassica campestris TaxID=3711 RepID=A0A8D9H7J3_BRACM|nr:unnamed protein product [Brassica rapa]